MLGKFLCSLGVHKLRRSYVETFEDESWRGFLVRAGIIVVFKCIREGCQYEEMD
jgi:hypothetical protein